MRASTLLHRILDATQLLWIQLVRVINLQMNGRMKRFQDILARHSPPLKSETKEGERIF
jgi:hypothetical protein